MLVIERSVDEEICIGDGIKIMVVSIDHRNDRRSTVKLGVSAPREIPVHRQEIYNAHKRDTSS